MFWCLSYDYDDLVEGEDYEDFRHSVTLTPGGPLTMEINAVIIDDNCLEKFEEVFMIQMELADQSLSSTVKLINTKKEVIIEDDDGWLCRTCLLMNNHLC